MTVFSALATVVRGACLMVAVWLSVEAAAWAQATTTPVTPTVAAVVKAVATEAEATVKAFNAGDAAALAGMFIEDGEVVDENGGVTESRTEIAALFKRFFERFPKATLEMEVTDAREIGDGVVIEEGVRRITTDQGAAAAQVRYVAVRTK